jgi:hypothetical protein
LETEWSLRPRIDSPVEGIRIDVQSVPTVTGVVRDMAIDVFHEPVVTVTEAVKRLPPRRRGKRPSLAKLYRCRKGGGMSTTEERDPQDAGAPTNTSQESDTSAPLTEFRKRQAILRDRIRGVARGYQNGFYLFGRPGTGKTFEVIQLLKQEGVRYYHHSGHLTPLGLFELIAEKHDHVIVLEDVAVLFSQKVALQILLAALGQQSGENRVVKYRRQGAEKSVTFTGGLILISNLDLPSSPLLLALKSRATYLKYEPTDEQIGALMKNVVADGWPPNGPTIPPDECLQVVEHLTAESNRLSCRLDLRLLFDKALPDYVQYKDGDTECHWRDLVTGTLESQLVSLSHPLRNSATREERKLAEQAIVRIILAEQEATPERMAAWRQATGKSDRAYYRRCAEIGVTH